MSFVIDEMMRFQTERNLHKNEYSVIDAHGNIVEELLESIGFDVSKENRPLLKGNIDIFFAGLVLNGVATTAPATTGDKVDAYCDIVEFAIGEIMKLGFHPERALLEMTKEINSRAGTIVDGKFEKDLSPEAQANWYKADYRLAKIQ